jgi:hypothetical protein
MLPPPPKNGDILGNGYKDFDYISVIYGDQYPNLCRVCDIFRQITQFV